jgi:hypothetical protein
MANTKRTAPKTRATEIKSNPIAPRVVLAPNTRDADYTPAQRAAAHLQTIPTDVLTSFVRGDVSALAVVLDELASRGVDPASGEWIGFPKAAELAAQTKDTLDARTHPKTKITRDGLVMRLTNDPTGARLIYVTIPE